MEPPSSEDSCRTTRPRALLSKDCVSLALGGWVEHELAHDRFDRMRAERPLRRYAGVVLSVATDSAPGSKLQDELAVTLHAGGLVLVTQADVEVARASVGVDESVDVAIELRPTLDDLNLPILIAKVTVAGQPILEGFTVATIGDLVWQGDCCRDPGAPRGGPGPG